MSVNGHSIQKARDVLSKTHLQQRQVAFSLSQALAGHAATGIPVRVTALLRRADRVEGFGRQEG